MSEAGGVRIQSEHRLVIAASREEVWEALRSPNAFASSEIPDGDVALEMIPGEWWRCTIRAPVLYTLDLVVTLRQVEYPALVVAEVTGDVEGSGRLEVQALAPADRTPAHRTGPDATPRDRASAERERQPDRRRGDGQGRVRPRPQERCEVRLSTELAPGSTPIRFLTATAGPLARWCHDRVLDEAGRRLARRARQEHQAAIGGAGD